MRIELNEGFKNALYLLENTSKNVFITGKAGTGKSTFLEYFRSVTKKKIAVLAPTGVAAVNVKGETIHSFFRFKPDITAEKVRKIKSRKKSSVYREINTIIIDEISMVRADLLDCVDSFLRLNANYPQLPFGGIQMIFIGDLYQLPPVVLSKEKPIFDARYKSPYFFGAAVFQNFSMEFVELLKVYRQKDEKFISLLNSIRNNTVTEEDLEIINQRMSPDLTIEDLDGYVYLTPVNRIAAQINHSRLEKIKSETHTYEAEIEGKFSRERLPADLSLELKTGAQVMLLNNDSMGRWVNGTIAKIAGIEKNESGKDAIMVELPERDIEEVVPYTWELFHYEFNEESRRLETEVTGKFTQYPLKLAWAITIHKSQGKTFDKVVIDISGGIFACGQTYVALSRCRYLEGIILTRPINKKHIFMDREIVKFLTSYQYRLSDQKTPFQEKIKIIEEAIKNNTRLKITYLKSSDEKSNRIVKPVKVGEMEYSGKPFFGMEAHCLERNDKRVFRVDRILEISRAQTEF